MADTPLPRKLGLKENFRIALIDAPADFPRMLGELPPGSSLLARPCKPLDLVVLFATTRARLEPRFAACAEMLAPAGMLWVAWPKKSARVPTDLSFDVVQHVGLEAGLVDTKICAIDDVWSGLKFVIRLKDRPAPS